MIDQNLLLEKYISTSLKITPQKTNKLFSIGFIGVNGVGKSYVAKLIAKKLGLFITQNDNVRRFLNNQGVSDVNTGEKNFPIMQYISEKFSEYLYQHSISHILDQDMIKFYEPAIERAAHNNCTFLLVKLICPEEIILQRLEQRFRDIDSGNLQNDSRVGVDEYQKRKKIHQEILISDENIYHTIDTSLDLESQIDKLSSKLALDGYL